ncbi:MAG TPA: L-2-amino-thiazoline-4-carboxylic acid hydrolase [Gemmataceae bacterium]|jgi:hypothetical protein|nr:L-2-amino-thiazoline-4-carboxylic acid hydrolase [Gemmataceae bacterium]
MPEPEPVSLLRQREIEARIVGPLYRAFAQEIGEERTGEIIARVIRELAKHSGCAAAERVGGNDIANLAEAKERWQEGNALSLEVIRQDDQALDFNVTRCRYAEMYRALGLDHLGALLSCNRDAAMIEGFNPAIKLTRTQTLMEGASHCDFRFRIESAPH